MEPVEQHIKNFFYFLQQKENREIPITIKIDKFSSELTEDELLDIFYNPERENERIRYFYNISGSYFSEMSTFSYGDGKIALGLVETMYGSFNPIFINKKGEPDVTGINPKELDDYLEDPEGSGGDELRAAYFNIIQDKYIFESVEKFDKYAENIALARTPYSDGNPNQFFINLKGELDATGINPKDLKELHERVAYFNSIQDKYHFKYVYAFAKDRNNFTFNEGNITFASLSDNDRSYIPTTGKGGPGNYIYINLKGEPDVTGVDPLKFPDIYKNTIDLINGEK